MSLRVLVCGGRDFNDPMTLGAWLGGIHAQKGIALMIEGGATGADTMARAFAKWAGIPVQTFLADWDRYQSAAGPIRNRQMLEEAKPDLVVAFEGGKGTKSMVKLARAAGVRVLEAHRVFDPALLQ